MTLRWTGQGRPASFSPQRRRLLAAAAAGGATLLMPPMPRARPAPVAPQACVGIDDPPPGTRRYDHIAAAIAAAPAQGETPFLIDVGPGRWTERLVIDRPHIHLRGAGAAATRVVHDTAAGHRRPDGTPWGTWGCATVTVRAPGFRASALAIENAFDYLGHLAAPQLETVGANGAQAVALMLDRGADRCRFDDVELVGHQDTLFVEAGRSHFRRCRVLGSVDFVFGAGIALLEDCELHSRHRPGKERQGYVAAPSTPASQPFGLVFRRCRLTRDPGVADGSVALGRAWRPTRDFPDGRYGDAQAVGAATFLDCWLDAHIAPEGWDPMAYTARNGERVMLPPRLARLAEHRNRGPGAQAHAGRPQLDDEEAARYRAGCILGGRCT